MAIEEVLAELESLGTEQCRKIYANHGAPADNMFGVKVGDMKKVLKKVKGDHTLALELYKTGNADAQYFAGLLADAKKLTKKDLDEWAKKATWYMVSEYSVAWNAAESPFGLEMALKWIDSKNEKMASSGWATLSNLLIYLPDEQIDKKLMEQLLSRVEKEIHNSPNRVRYTMNGFVIAVGGYVPSLSKKAIETAKRIGKVEVFMGKTSCQVPDAAPYIQKVIARSPKKKKTLKC